MTDKEPDPLDNPEFVRVINDILDLPPEALADEEHMSSICKHLASIIDTQRTLIEELDELFNDNMTTTEALEALVDAGITPPSTESVQGMMDSQRAYLYAIEAVYGRLEPHLSPQGRRDITAHIIDRRRVERTVDAITDRYDNLMNEGEEV